MPKTKERKAPNRTSTACSIKITRKADGTFSSNTFISYEPWHADVYQLFLPKQAILAAVEGRADKSALARRLRGWADELDRMAADDAKAKPEAKP
jgi:hypothetical protein